jgi:hypothetical protein
MASPTSLGFARRWSPVLANRGETRNNKDEHPTFQSIQPQSFSILSVPNGQPSWQIQRDNVIFLMAIHQATSLAPPMKQLDVAPPGIYVCPTDFV